MILLISASCWYDLKLHNYRNSISRQITNLTILNSVELQHNYLRRMYSCLHWLAEKSIICPHFIHKWRDFASGILCWWQSCTRRQGIMREAFFWRRHTTFVACNGISLSQGWISLGKMLRIRQLTMDLRSPRRYISLKQ